MSRVRVRVTGSPSLRERVVGLDDLQVTDGPPTVEADSEALLRLFELENPLRNAREHAGNDVTVRVVPLTDADYDAPVGFAVADDGRGISPDEREQVFDSSYTTGDGTGLGLPIVRSIAEAHGWSVSVGERVGRGAVRDTDGVIPSRLTAFAVRIPEGLPGVEPRYSSSSASDASNASNCTCSFAPAVMR